MFADRIEAKWIDMFCSVFELCALKPGDTAAILSETQSREINVHLAELALQRLGTKPFHVRLVSPAQTAPVPVRSTGASNSVQGLEPVVAALAASTTGEEIDLLGDDGSRSYALRSELCFCKPAGTRLPCSPGFRTGLRRKSIELGAHASI